MRERTVAFKRQSRMLPSSEFTRHSIATLQTYLPESMHRDSGSRALEPTTAVSSNFAASFASFLCSSLLPLQLVQSTRKKTFPSEGLSFLGAVISTFVLIVT